MMDDIMAEQNRLSAKMRAQQAAVQRVMERQRRRDEAAAYGKIIPFDDNDFINHF